jgi:nitroreductase
MSKILEALFHRRAVKAFEPVEIPQVLREQILDAARHAPSSFNMQPYRFFWVESSPRKATAVGVDAQERLQPRQSPRLRADGEDRPDPVHARTVRDFWRGQVGDFSTGEFVEDDRDATSVSTGLVKVGDEEYIVGL